MCLLTCSDDLGKLMTNIQKITKYSQEQVVPMRHDLSLQKRIAKWWYFFHSGMMGIRSIVCTKVIVTLC